MPNIILAFLVIILIVGGISYSSLSHHSATPTSSPKQITPTIKPTPTPAAAQSSSPLAIENMRKKLYPGSLFTIEQTLSPGSDYTRYVVSYKSDGLKLYGLLTVPTGTKPSGGWPVILFNHGYIPPALYSTINSYAVMVDPLAVAGYIVFKPDYRGNGNSQGTPTQSYITPDYVTDSMNALASIKQYKDANSDKIGVFGHSMGGNISLHELVMTHDIKAAELMAGVVCNETDLLQWWNQRVSDHSIEGNDLQTASVIESMVKEHGTPTSNPLYWNAIDPAQYLDYISAPIEIQVGTADTEVPVACSTTLNSSLQKAGKTVTFHEYQGADHNLSPNTSSAMAETVAFFNKYLK